VGGTVRDTLVFLGILGITIGGFLTFRDHFKKQHQEINQKIAATRRTSHPSTVRKQIKQKLGASQNESTNYRSHEQERSFDPSSGASGEVTESDKLPDLYQTEELSERSAVEEDTVIAESLEQPQESSVIAGVPVAAWVKANRNRLKEFQVTPPTQQTLRVYLGCLELKKGSQATEKHVCEKLLTAKDSKLATERERY